MFQTATPRRVRKMAGEISIDHGTQLPPANEDARNEPAAIAVGTSADFPGAIKSPAKISIVLDLLQRVEGSTLDEIISATGWLPHSARAALTGVRKKGHVITSKKNEFGPRIYYIKRVSNEVSAG